LTLFIAITAALLNAILGKATPPSLGVSISLKIGGLLAVCVFWIMEERAADFFFYYKGWAVELEKLLGYKQYSCRPQREVITTTNAVRLFFGTLGIFWLLFLACPSLFLKHKSAQR
jgi:hypothetical protein